MGDGISRSELVEGLAACSSRWTRSELERMEDGRLAAAAFAAAVTPSEIMAAAEGGDLAGLRADFSALAANRRDGPGEELDFEVHNIMSGPRGEAAIDGEQSEGRTENAGDGGGLGFETRRIMSGRRGEAVLDD